MRLKIDNPCQENWNSMLPDEKGRFCKSCHKTVVDFSKLSDGELLDFFTKKSPEKNVCGKFRKDQLDREVYTPKPVPNYYNRWFALAFGFFSIVKTASSQTLARRDESGIVLKEKKKQQNKGIRGTVKDQYTGEPLPHASVMIAGTNVGMMTDSSGAFQLSPAKYFRDGKIKLVAKYIGSKTTEAEIREEDSTVTIYMEPQAIALESVEVVGYKTPLIDHAIVGAVRCFDRPVMLGGVHVEEKKTFKTRVHSFFHHLFHPSEWKRNKKKED